MKPHGGLTVQPERVVVVSGLSLYGLAATRPGDACGVGVASFAVVAGIVDSCSAGSGTGM